MPTSVQALDQERRLLDRFPGIKQRAAAAAFLGLTLLATQTMRASAEQAPAPPPAVTYEHIPPPPVEPKPEDYEKLSERAPLTKEEFRAGFRFGSRHWNAIERGLVPREQSEVDPAMVREYLALARESRDHTLSFFKPEVQKRLAGYRYVVEGSGLSPGGFTALRYRSKYPVEYYRWPEKGDPHVNDPDYLEIALVISEEMPRISTLQKDRQELIRRSNRALVFRGHLMAAIDVYGPGTPEKERPFNPQQFRRDVEQWLKDIERIKPGLYRYLRDMHPIKLTKSPDPRYELEANHFSPDRVENAFITFGEAIATNRLGLDKAWNNKDYKNQWETFARQVPPSIRRHYDWLFAQSRK